MKDKTKSNIAIAVGILGVMFNGAAFGQVVSFSTTDPGQTKAITEWGIEVVQGGKAANSARLYKGILGDDGIDVLWSFFWPGAALTGSGNLAQEHKDVADGFIDGDWVTYFPNAAWGFGPNVGDTDAYFFSGSSLDTTKWYNLVKKHVEYYQSRGQTVAYMMPFNEPYYWAGQGPAAEVPSALNTIAQLLADDSSLDGIGIMGPSTLESAAARDTYVVAQGPLTHGSTHHLQWYNSASWIADFYTYVLAQGDVAYNPELHALGEAIFSAEYGCTGGAWWNEPDRLLPRALFMTSCQGSRLGYAENRGGDSTAWLTQSAAAVYLAPDGELYGFAGGFERQTADGSMNNYRFVCTDRDVYFNGIGPIREYVLPVRNAQDAFVKIEYGTDIMPALDGHRWKIKNRLTGHVMEVVGGNPTDGTDIQEAPDANDPRQKWDILLFKDGYYVMYNATTGKPMDNYGWSIGDGGNVAQWSDTGGLNQRWFIESAGDGYYYIRNGHGTLYVDGNLSGASVKQYAYNGQHQQQWQFVLADPTVSGTPAAQYDFEGNANDSVGSNHGTTFGSPAYVTGQDGQAIDLDGVNDYVTLPAGIADVDDITVAAWVNWDGGGAQQRIFDFGNNTDEYFFLTPSDFDGLMHCAITTSSYRYEDGLVTDGLPIGQWVHVAVTLRGNTGILYLNGSPKVAGYMSLNPSDFNPVVNYIGKSQWSADAMFNGRIDAFQIYDYAMTPAEIASLAGVTPPAPPSTPTGLSAVSSDSQVALSWNVASNATSYAVKYSLTNGGPYAVVGNPATTSMVHMGLTNGTTYYYVLSAVGSGGESTNSVQVSAVPSAAIAPEEFLIAGHAIEGGTNLFLMTSNSVPGHLYYLLSTETLTPPEWSTNTVEAGDGSPKQFGIPIDPAATSRFFKLDVQRQ